MTPIGWLRTSYRVGAVVDALAAVQMVRAGVVGSELARAGFVPGPDHRYAFGMGASLMLGWTALLLWADRNPLERRGVLPITIAVVLGLAANEAVAVGAGFLRLGPAIGLGALQAALVALFANSHSRSRRAA